MATFDTTATCQLDGYENAANANTSFGTSITLPLNGTGGQQQWPGLQFVLPNKPTGVDGISKITLVLCYASNPLAGTFFATPWSVVSGKQWKANDFSWNYYDTTALALWGTAGGDFNAPLQSQTITAGTPRSSTFAFEISSIGLDWGKHGGVIFQSGSGGSANPLRFLSLDSTTGTVALKPHIVITAVDNPPAPVTILTVTPDLSLSESSYTYRQRPVLTWSKSPENDFKRYRIRSGVNRSLPSNMTTRTFVNSAGSVIYLDTNSYTDGSTVYWAIYPEDTRNGSTSTFLGATYCNVSNVISWTKPDATVGGLNFASSASTLDQVEARVRTTTMANAKKLKLIWGDGSVAYSQNLTSAGGYLYARHRYTKATSGYAIRGIIEDIYGFRSAPKSYSTSITISNLGPIAKIVASPSRQRTGGTFSIGNVPASNGNALNSQAIYIDFGQPSPADGVGLRFGTRATALGGSGSLSAQLWRIENDRIRCIYSDSMTLGTSGANVYRNIDWSMKKGDMLGFQSPNGGINLSRYGNNVSLWNVGSMSTTIIPGQSLSRYRLVTQMAGFGAAISLAYTNPISLSAKDSFARGSNRSISRFRWAPNYAGDFGAAYATGGSYTTGATSSFHWAWTTATTQFVAVRAVDDTNASSIDVAGVVIETESTFRIPDNLQHVAVHLSEKRPRAYTHSPALSRDYGTIDMGALEPWTINVRGRSIMSTATNNFYGDISNLQAAFQQRWRIYVRAPATTSSYVQGYLVDVPFVQDTNEPTVKVWDATVVVAT